LARILKPGGFRMNRSSLGLLSLSKAITGFVNFKMAEGLSHRSVDSYQHILEKWVEFSGDKDIGAVTHHDITQYLGWLRTDYIPQRFNNKTHPLSPKTLRNIWITLSFLDAGLRALELCSLRVGDVDTKTGKVDIRHGGEGGAKGRKGRTVYLGKAARRAVWRYLAERKDGEDPEAPLFVVRGDWRFTLDTLMYSKPTAGPARRITGGCDQIRYET
jgi:site-specific recombinase XerD